MSGDLEGARKVMIERLEQARADGNDFVVSVESSNLAMVERQLGNLDKAESLSLDALRIDSRKGDVMAIGWVINGLAAVIAAKGQLAPRGDAARDCRFAPRAGWRRVAAR